MIHQHIFASPKPGMSEEDFHRYWIENHAVNYASKIKQIKRYMIDTRIDFAEEKKPPIWNGIAEIWIREEEQLESLQSEEFLQGARLDEPKWAAFWNTLVLDTDAEVIVEGPPLTASDPWVKYIVLLKRKSGMPVEEFRKVNRKMHAPLVEKMPGLRRFLICDVRDSWYDLGETRFDGLIQTWYDDVEALNTALASPECNAVKQACSDYFETKYLFTMAVREHWIIGPESR